MTTLSVIGLGKLGSPLLAVFADAGFTVIGVDATPETVAAINDGRAPVWEPGLQDLLTARQGHYRATADTRAAVREAAATFVIVPTPSGPDGGFTLDYVLPACREIGAALAETNDYKLIVLVSTVMPGQTRELCAVLEQVSGKRQGRDFGLCYSPEFIALGSVIHDLQRPDYVLIGEQDARAGDALEAIWLQVVRSARVVPVARMSWVNAEIAKIAENNFLTLKIEFANELGRFCQAIPGANVDDVVRALGLDSRIGVKYLKAGTAFGGPCLPRDGRALVRSAEQHLAYFPLAGLVVHMNGVSAEELREVVFNASRRLTAVGILGLAYKPNTGVIEESAGIKLARDMAGIRSVIVYDPLAMPAARTVLGDSVIYADSAAQCVDSADVVVLMHPVRELLPVEAIREGQTIIDPWRVWPPPQYDMGGYFPVRYIPLGIGPTEQETETA